MIFVRLLGTQYLHACMCIDYGGGAAGTQDYNMYFSRICGSPIYNKCINDPGDITDILVYEILVANSIGYCIHGPRQSRLLDAQGLLEYEALVAEDARKFGHTHNLPSH